MYISMHGGGGTTQDVNNQQWKNQQQLYGTMDGLYWVPRTPIDEWNMWHREYMEDFQLKAVKVWSVENGIRLDIICNHCVLSGSNYPT